MLSPDLVYMTRKATGIPPKDVSSREIRGESVQQDSIPCDGQYTGFRPESLIMEKYADERTQTNVLRGKPKS